jgi:selenocysteine lyase/cysteine desulfurase
MSPQRRDVLKGLGGVAAMAAFGKLGAQVTGVSTPAAPNGQPGQAPTFPRKGDFEIEAGYTYINAAYTHPMPRVATDAVQRYVDGRRALRAPATGGGRGGGGGGAANNAPRADPKALFAELINAKPTEIAYVPNTSTGENLVVNGLGLDRKFVGNVVTDGLHYDGALVHLLELKRQGLDVRVVRPNKEFRIAMSDLEKAIDKNTKLVEVSSTAMYNGFQHDLKAVFDVAHANGAYVYADIIHSAGAEPFDVRASGVDFAACSSFKWLMGDFGLGFLYAKEDLLEPVIARSQIGYYQLSSMSGHFPPFDPREAEAPVSWAFRKDAMGSFEIGTIGGSIAAGLGASLGYVKQLGVANIQAHRQPLLKKLRAEVPRFGFTPVTPPESTAGVITFAKENVGSSGLPQKLQAARVNVRFSTHWMRLSPSVYNDLADVDRFLEALS